MSLEKTKCPKCGKAFRFASEHLGSKTRCKSCQAIFVIARPAPATAKPVQAKPVAAKPVQAKPVQAKPVVAKPVVAKPVQAKPVAAKPVQAKPVVAKPVAARPAVAKPAKPVAAAAKQVASPYEAFAEEIMTGNNVVTAQRLTAASGNGNAAAYLATNRKLNVSKKRKRSSDWATTFIFRGVSLAIFGFLLFGISMLGLATFAFISGPIGAMIAVAVGLVGSIMVMIGFAAKPGSAAACGLIPAILFVAGGLLVGKLFLDGYWNFASQNMAVAKSNPLDLQGFAGENVQAQRNNKFNAPAFGGDHLARLQREQERDRIAREKDLADRKKKRQNRDRRNDAIGQDVGPDPLPQDPFEDVRKRQERMMKDAVDRSERQANEIRDRMAKARDRNRKPFGNDIDPFNSPDVKDALGGMPQPDPKSKPGQVGDDPFVNDNQKMSDKPKETDPAGAENKDDAGSDDSEEVVVKEIPAFFSNSKITRLNFSLRSNATKKYGGQSVFNFPKKNLTSGGLGQESTTVAYPLIGNSGQLVLGIDAVRGSRGAGVRTMVPVFNQADSSLTIAKDGYVVGGLEAAFVDNEMVLFRAIYMKLDGKKLDDSDQYFGDWFGDEDQIANAKQITTDGRPVIGIRIHGNGEVSGFEFIRK